MCGLGLKCRIHGFGFRASLEPISLAVSSCHVCFASGTLVSLRIFGVTDLVVACFVTVTGVAIVQNVLEWGPIARGRNLHYDKSAEVIALATSSFLSALVRVRCFCRLFHNFRR